MEPAGARTAGAQPPRAGPSRPAQRTQAAQRVCAFTFMLGVRTCERRRRAGGGTTYTRLAHERPQRLAGFEPRPADTTVAFSDLNCAGHEQTAPFRVRSFLRRGVLTVFELF